MTMTERQTIGKRIKELRERAGMSQSQLARRTALATTTFSRIENDKVKPHDATLQAIEVALNLEPGSLLDWPR